MPRKKSPEAESRAEVSQLIKQANGQISEKLPDIINKLIEIGNGVQAVGHARGNGEEYVYDIPPNFRALEYLCNRVLGRPVDSNVLGGEGEVAEIKVRFVDDWREEPGASPIK